MQSVFRQISGEQVDRLFGQEQFLEAINAVVSTNPVPAVQKIRDAYGLGKSFHGWQIPIFDIVCDVAYEAEIRDRRSYYLNLTASHTHWDINKPIVYTFSEHRGTYIVGNISIGEQSSYTPVSFFKFRGKVWAYEWIDDVVRSHFPEVETHYSVIEDILLNFIGNEDPFGIGVDYRFRFDPAKAASGSVEVPIMDDESLSDFSEIYDAETFLSREWEESGVEVVAWPFNSDLKKISNISTQSISVLRDIKTLLRLAQTSEEREIIFESLFEQKI